MLPVCACVCARVLFVHLSYLGETAATSPEEVFQSFDKFLGVVHLELQQYLTDKERMEKKARMEAAAAAKQASPVKSSQSAGARASALQ